MFLARCLRGCLVPHIEEEKDLNVQQSWDQDGVPSERHCVDRQRGPDGAVCKGYRATSSYNLPFYALGS